jgi:16S rRNA processing protein RimM
VSPSDIPGSDREPDAGERPVPADATTPADDGTPSPPMVPLGRVGKPHGLDGTVTVTRPRGDLLVHGLVLTVAGVRREIVKRTGSDAKPLLRLSGLDHIDEAEKLRGAEILAPRDVLPELDEDEFWPDDLVGLPVHATTGELVGEVALVRVLPSVDVMEVRRPGAPDLLVPLHREAVPVLEIGDGRIEVDLVFMGEAEDPQDAGGAGPQAAGEPPAAG